MFGNTAYNGANRGDLKRNKLVVEIISDYLVTK